MRDALDARDVNAWREFPIWFGSARGVEQTQARCRADAARWLPVLDRSEEIDASLLSDPHLLVRVHTAMRWVEADLDVEPAALQALLAGVVEPDWIWSMRERFNGGLDGPNLAMRFFLEQARRTVYARSSCDAVLREALRKTPSDCPSRCRLELLRRALDVSRNLPSDDAGL